MITPILSLALFFSQSGVAESATAEQVAIPVATLQIPDEVAPAVFPYMLCAQSAAGIPVYGPNQQLVIEPDSGKDCTDERAKALMDGVTMLQRQGLGTDDGARAKYVNAILDEIEEYSRPKTDEEVQETVERHIAEKERQAETASRSEAEPVADQ